MYHPSPAGDNRPWQNTLSSSVAARNTHRPSSRIKLHTSNGTRPTHLPTTLQEVYITAVASFVFLKGVHGLYKIEALFPAKFKIQEGNRRTPSTGRRREGRGPPQNVHKQQNKHTFYKDKLLRLTGMPDTNQGPQPRLFGVKNMTPRGLKKKTHRSAPQLQTALAYCRNTQICIQAHKGDAAFCVGDIAPPTTRHICAFPPPSEGAGKMPSTIHTLAINCRAKNNNRSLKKDGTPNF